MKILLIAITSVAMFSSCKSVDVGSGSFHPVSIQKDLTSMELQDIRSNVKRQIEFRITNQPRDVQLISNDWWKIEGYYNAGEVISAVNDDFWMKVENDHTYKLGSQSTVSEIGICHYDDEKGSLLLLPNDESLQPKIWRVQLSGDQFVLFGTQEYGINNGMQIKFILLGRNPLAN